MLYAGAPMRALAFAARRSCSSPSAPGSLLRMDRLELVGLVLNPFVLTSVFVVNLVALLYRLVAIVDAYRVDRVPQRATRASGDGRLGPARLPRDPLSIAGLLAVVLVMAGGHVVVARYDLLALDALNSGCIFVGEDDRGRMRRRTPRRRRSLGVDRADRRAADPTASPTPEPTPVGTRRSRTCRSRRGTARSASTSCSSAPTSRAAATTPTR